MKKIRVPDIIKMKSAGRKIPVLTAYNFQMARILDAAGIPVILVGDSAGMVERGYSTTLPVTMEEMIYHTKSVTQGCASALIVSDMPFMSYQVSAKEARKNAGRLIKQGGAEAIKIEGGSNMAKIIEAVTSIDIPVMAHIGLTPQSIHRMGGYKVQGRSDAERERIIADALSVEEAGAFSVVLECIPSGLAREITEMLSIPTIGIGAGAFCDGQVLVLNDMLGLNGDKLPGFVKKYADLDKTIMDAVSRYKDDVEKGRFPAKKHFLK